MYNDSHQNLRGCRWVCLFGWRCTQNERTPSLSSPPNGSPQTSPSDIQTCFFSLRDSEYPRKAGIKWDWQTGWCSAGSWWHRQQDKYQYFFFFGLTQFTIIYHVRSLYCYCDISDNQVLYQLFIHVLSHQGGRPLSALKAQIMWQIKTVSTITSGLPLWVLQWLIQIFRKLGDQLPIYNVNMSLFCFSSFCIR